MNVNKILEEKKKEQYTCPERCGKSSYRKHYFNCCWKMKTAEISRSETGLCLPGRGGRGEPQGGVPVNVYL